MLHIRAPWGYVACIIRNASLEMFPLSLPTHLNLLRKLQARLFVNEEDGWVHARPARLCQDADWEKMVVINTMQRLTDVWGYLNGITNCYWCSISNKNEHRCSIQEHTIIFAATCARWSTNAQGFSAWVHDRTRGVRKTDRHKVFTQNVNLPTWCPF